MSKKAEALIKKHTDIEKEISVEALFGGTKVIKNNFEDTEFSDYIDEKEQLELEKKKEEEPVDDGTAKEILILSDEDINKHFVNKHKPKEPAPVEEKVIAKDDMYGELFGDFEVEEFGSTEIPKEEPVEEPVAEVPEEEAPKEELTIEELESDIPRNDLLRIRELTGAENYPTNFPDYEAILALKKLHGEILFIISGNLFEELNFGIKPEIFIATTFKTDSYIEFTSRGGSDLEVGLFYPYLINSCVLFPQIEFEEVFDLPAGTVKQIVDNILINSKYKTSIEVIKL